MKTFLFSITNLFLVLTIFGTTPTVQQRLNDNETPYQIFEKDTSLLDSLYGKIYQGGYIFYLNTADGSGMVAALKDIQQTVWGCNGIQIFEHSEALGSGQKNTLGIISQCSPPPENAAHLCETLVMDGFDDWYLPSKDEAGLMHTNMAKVGQFVWAEYYWTSTQWGWSSSMAWTYRISDGVWNQYTKNSILRVRPVRTFTEPTLPSVSSTTISAVTHTSANAYSTITHDGGGSIKKRGFCYSTKQNPDTSAFVVVDTIMRGGDSIFASIKGLSVNTKYYVRSFVINNKGISYGTQTNFTTDINIGDHYDGGIVFYILQSGDAGYDPNVKHGIIANSNRYTYGFLWGNLDSAGCDTTSLAPNDTSIGGGKVNYNRLSRACDDITKLPAVYECASSGYYLPSKAELSIMRQYRSMLNMGGGGMHNQGDMYWSSSMSDWYPRKAWAHSFYYEVGRTSGGPDYDELRAFNNSFPVRGIKYF